MTIWGSSSCPSVPVALDVLGRHQVQITVASEGGACTADLSATTSVIQLDPAAVDTASQVQVTVHEPSGAPATIIARRR